MVEVIRVENAQGYGPYSVQSKLPEDIYKRLLNHSCDHKRPTGARDIPRFDWVNTTAYRFGFLLEKDLHQWFEKDLLDDLIKVGFTVQRYLVDCSQDDEAILLGTAQIAFRAEFANKV